MPADDSAAGSGSAPGVTPQEFNEFISTLQLDVLRLSRLEVEAPHAYVPGRQLTPQTEIQAAEYVATDAGFVVRYSLTFEGRYEGEAEPVLRVAARFEITYSAGRAITDEIFRVFRDTSLPLNVWPYFRELVHTALARAGWPVLLLPVHRGPGRPVT